VPLPEVSQEQKGKLTTVSQKQVRNQMVRVKADVDKNCVHTILIENQKRDVLKADGKTLDAEKFRQELLPYTRGDQRKTELLLDAGDVSWGMVIAIQDAAQSAGINTVRHLAK